MQKTSATEQRGMCAGGKKPPARSIKQVFQTFKESLENRTAGRKDFFDTLNKQETNRFPACFEGGVALCDTPALLYQTGSCFGRLQRLVLQETLLGIFWSVLDGFIIGQDQCADLCTLFQQLQADVAAQETGCAGDKVDAVVHNTIGSFLSMDEPSIKYRCFGKVSLLLWRCKS